MTPVGTYPHDAARVAGGQVLIGDEAGGTLSVVTDGTVTRTLDSQTQPGGVAVVGDTARCPLPGTPYGLAEDATASVLCVTPTAANEVVGLSTAGDALTELTRFPTVRQPDTVAVDPTTGRVFVGSRSTGELESIDVR